MKKLKSLTNKKYNLLQFIITMLFLCTVGFQKSNLLFAVTIQKYTIAPLNRLTVKFDKLPENIESSLSANKKEISINLKNATFTDEKKSLTGEGIIRQINLQKKDGETILSLSLAEQRGYTIARLPFSQSLVIEVFDWNKLNTAEEAYRMGLLSLIDYENELAKNDLQTAVKENIGDAAAFLGFIFLAEGKINSALKNFRFAEIKNTTINDNYAALHQIYKLQNNNEKTEHYAKIYKQKTKENQVPTIVFPLITELRDTSLEDLSHIDSVINANENIAENLMDETEENDTNKIDSTQKNIAEKDTVKQSIWEAENWLLTKYAIGIAVAILLGIVYLYLKWRNKQLLILQAKAAEDTKNAENKKSEKRADSKKNNASTQTSTKKTETNKTENFSSLIDNKMAEIKKPTTVNNSASVKNNKETISKKRITDQVDIKKNADSLLSLIDKMKADDVIKSDTVLKSELTAANLKAGVSAYQTFSKNISDDSKNNANENSKNIPKKHSANIELANRLANEQKKIKEEKLSGLGNTLGLEASKLIDVAQKLGLEKNTIETKQNLENLISKEEEFTKLSEKFGIK